MEPLATVTELQERIEWTLDEGEVVLAESAIEDLSDDARLYGNESWGTPQTTPRPVINLIIRAAKRYLRNPDGFIQSRAGDETVQWSDKDGQGETAQFTDREVKMLKTYSGTPAVYSVEFTAWNSKIRNDETGYVTSDPSDKPFPMFANEYE